MAAFVGPLQIYLPAAYYSFDIKYVYVGKSLLLQLTQKPSATDIRTPARDNAIARAIMTI